MATREERLKALQRVRARVASVAALRSATSNYEVLDKRFWGYEDSLARQDSLRNRLGSLEMSQSRKPLMSGTASDRESYVRPMTKNEKRFSRGLLGPVNKFNCSSRGITVRSGDPGVNEWSKVMSADLKISYALHLLENDMPHFRYLYRQTEKQKKVFGRNKLFIAKESTGKLPDLWIEYPEVIIKKEPTLPTKGMELASLLQDSQDLWKEFHTFRKKRADEITSKRKTDLIKAQIEKLNRYSPLSRAKDAALGYEVENPLPKMPRPTAM